MRLFLILCLAFLPACSLLTKAQKGGGASVSASVNSPATAKETAPVGILAASTTIGQAIPTATITQPDNPQGSSGQSVSYQHEEVAEVPVDTVKKTVTDYPDGRKVTVEEPMPAGTRIIKRSNQKVEQQLGGSWKDLARETAAALGSFQWVQYIGVVVFLLGAVGYFHPVVRPIIGGKDTALVVGLCGMVMIFGPYLLVAYSKYFILAILGAAAYWIVARLKFKEGILEEKTKKETTPPFPNV